MKRYRITAPAASDMEAIHDYYFQFSPKFAIPLSKRLLDRCRLQGRFPDLGTDRSDFHPGLRSAVVGDYLIFFSKMKSEVQVIRVLHGSRDITATDFV